MTSHGDPKMFTPESNRCLAQSNTSEGGIDTMDLPSPSSAASGDVTPSKHTVLEDALALFIGAILLSTGIEIYKAAGLLSGGIAGVTFLLHYATGSAFGPLFFGLSIPFYWFALRRMGYAFTLKSLAAVTLVAVLSDLSRGLITIESINIAYASLIGGVTLGTGFLVLFRHRASPGGVGVFVLYLQDRFGWRAGAVQMAIDCAIVISAFFVIDPLHIVWSVVGAVALNAIIALNHKPGRYLGF